MMRILLAIFLLLGTATAAVAAQALGARTGEHGDRTRFVIDLSAEVEFRVFLLPDPYRAVIDFPELDWAGDGAAGPAGPRRGLVEGYRFGLFQAGTSRVVLDLAGPAQVADAFLLAPRDGVPHWRFVLDLVPSERAAFLRAADKGQAARPAALAAARPPPKPAEDRRPLVVIDPGHGGVDPGAIGAGGRYEKDLVLALARDLRERLAASGRYRVMLTRERDVFLSLAERVEFARARAADLFLSIHADSLHDPSISGATVYTLSEKASDSASELLAQRENRADLIAGVDLSAESDEVSAILIDLAQRETMNHSARLAQSVVQSFDGQVEMLRKPHRFAGFRVLKAPDVPSILLEVGYLSNPADEARIGSARGRDRLARALAGAIDRYFEARPRAQLGN
jgi:N-acetylmuramoyl-L-alanine amidase